MACANQVFHLLRRKESVVQPLQVLTRRLCMLSSVLCTKRPATKLFCKSSSVSETNANKTRHLSFAGDDSEQRSSVQSPEFASCSFSEHSRMLTIRWQDGQVADFPSIFLRDNCQCPLCFHQSSQQRLLDTARTVDLRINPSDTKISHNGKRLKLLWEDEHQSDFSSDWLRERILPKTRADVKPRNVAGLKHRLWNNKLEGNIPSFKFSDVLADGKIQYSWIATLAQTGVAVLEDAPTKPGQLAELARRFTGYPRLTNYGEIFTVKKKAQPSNLAYTMNFLPLHTDLPYFDYQPGIQVLHCIEQSGHGGTNQLVDGFYIAQVIREKYPEVFETLTQTKFSFTDIGKDEYGDFMLQLDRPIIKLDQFGNTESISHNNHVRDSYVNAPAEDVKRAYEAYYLFVKLMYDSQNIVEYKMNPGDILTFHNRRVLHGRTAYDASKASRWLEGCYFDWDEAFSVMRILAKRHSIKI